MYADVAGYSRLTGEDEVATHEALRIGLAIFTTTIESNGGRVNHYAGDAVLAEFGFKRFPPYPSPSSMKAESGLECRLRAGSYNGRSVFVFRVSMDRLEETSNSSTRAMRFL